MHDSSVSFAIGPKVVLVLEAERIFRQKKKLCTHGEMETLVRHGLERLGKTIEDVDYWAMTTLNNPYLTRFDVVDFQKKQLRGPHWKEVEMFGARRKVLIVNHHLAHAAIYLATPFDSALIVSCDGGGDFDESTGWGECLAVFTADGNEITKHDIPHHNFITGKTYGVVAEFLYDAKYSEGKLMALAGSGTPRKEYQKFLFKNLDIIEKNSHRKSRKLLEAVFPGMRGSAAQAPSRDARDFAATVHEFFVSKRIENTDYLVERFGSGCAAFVLVGGAGLNLDLNTRIRERYPQFEHFVPPCCDDTGQSLGALCMLIDDLFEKRTDVHFPYLGEGTERFHYTEEALKKAAAMLAKDGVLIVHNGRSEVGPRALGNRSLIARPDKVVLRKKLSEEIKQREPYRPVAPVVMEEKADEYFNGPKRSPFMLYRYLIKPSQADSVVGAVHIDGSARVQTVSQADNPFLHDLIRAFGDKTGIYALLNTSLNLKGQPMANSIEESLGIYEKIRGPKMIVHDGTILKSSDK